LAETPADKKFLFGTMTRVTAAKEKPGSQTFTFLTICCKYGDDNTLRDGLLHFVQQYTVDESEAGKRELLALGDNDLLESVFSMGESSNPPL
jgi:hypothetical protein